MVVSRHAAPTCTALAVAASLGAALGAQGPPPVQGLLIDPYGKTVSEAEVLLVPDPVPELPALAGLIAPGAPRPAPGIHNGVFKIDAGGPGLLFARTARGLGALAAHADPGRAVRLQLRPMAEVTAPQGAELIALWPALLDDRGAPRHLPPQRGNARLPAGTYSAWYQTRDGFGRQRLQLRSGESFELGAPKERRTLACARGLRIAPLDFPQIGFPLVELPAGGGTGCVLLGDAVRATLACTWETSGLLLPIGSVEARTAPDWPPAHPPAPTLRVELAGPPAAAGAGAWLLERTRRGDWRLLAHSLADSERRVTVPHIDGGDCWLLCVAGGCAPAAFPLVDLRDGSRLELHTGRSLSCTVSTDDGADTAGVAVDFEPDGEAPATIRARTDDRGMALLAPIATAGTLRIEDPRFCPVAMPIAGEASVAVRLARGAAIAGVVRAADRPAGRATVTLRDPQNLLRPAERAATTDAEGRFAFAGLPERGRYVLFAQQVRDGRTWSGRLDVGPGTADAVVTLTVEDPQLRAAGNGR
jgi:hypothetical protein